MTFLLGLFLAGNKDNHKILYVLNQRKGDFFFREILRRARGELILLKLYIVIYKFKRGDDIAV